MTIQIAYKIPRETFDSIWRNALNPLTRYIHINYDFQHFVLHLSLKSRAIIFPDDEAEKVPEDLMSCNDSFVIQKAERMLERLTAYANPDTTESGCRATILR